MPTHSYLDQLDYHMFSTLLCHLKGAVYFPDADCINSASSMMLFLPNHIRRRGLSCTGWEAESRCRLCFYGLPREETSKGEGEGYGDIQRKWNKLHKNWIISTDNANGKTCRSPERYYSRFVIVVRQSTRRLFGLSGILLVTTNSGLALSYSLLDKLKDQN